MNEIGKSAYIVLICAILLASVVMPFSAMVNPSVARAIEVAEDNGYIVIPSTFSTDLSAIKSKTDLIPTDPATYGNQTVIIDQLDVMDSASYGKSVWAGKSADQSGDNWAEDTTMTPFRLTSGNNTWVSCIMLFAVSTMSASYRDAPTLAPLAAKNVLAIPPPTIS